MRPIPYATAPYQGLRRLGGVLLVLACALASAAVAMAAGPDWPRLTGLTGPEREQADAGATLFDAVAGVPGPLGPRRARFGAASCAACHAGGGRGETGGNLPPSLILRVSRVAPATADAGSAPPHPAYGLQIDPLADPPAEPEAHIAVHWEDVPGRYPDGTVYSLRRPVITLETPLHGPLGPGDLISPRVGQPLFGLGLVEAVPAAVLADLADPDDADLDGISGRVARLPDGRIGRFGWKAQFPTLAAQTAAALADDMGVEQPNPGVVASLTTHVATLAPPRPAVDPDRHAGARLFAEVGCAACHTPRLPVGDTTIAPYGNFLLHDLGPGLADWRPEAAANGREWRTAPLWGLSRVPGSSVRALLHDGRARSVEEAILWHGGEAHRSVTRFRALPAYDRDTLIDFVEGL